MNPVKVTLFTLLAVLLMACHAQTQPSLPVVKNTLIYTDANGNRQLTMPKVPANLRDVESRASFLAQHFWTHFSFTDTVVMHDTDLMEQVFVNFLSVLPMSCEKEALAGIDSLWTGAQADTLLTHKLLSWSEKYLYEPNSPMLNENTYNLFLQVVLPTVQHDAVLAEKLAYYKRVTETNRVGRLANNFYYHTQEGRQSLLDVQSPYTLVMFFDPDCAHCNEYLEALKSSDVVSQAVSSGKLKILAVYAEPHPEGFQKALQKIPSHWICGYDPDDVIQSRGQYFLRAMPTLILLDESKIILGKDITPADVESFFSLEQ